MEPLTLEEVKNSKYIFHGSKVHLSLDQAMRLWKGMFNHPDEVFITNKGTSISEYEHIKEFVQYVRDNWEQTIPMTLEEITN